MLRVGIDAKTIDSEIDLIWMKVKKNTKKGFK